MLSHERNNTQAQGKDIRDGDVAREKLTMLRGAMELSIKVFWTEIHEAMSTLQHVTTSTIVDGDRNAKREGTQEFWQHFWTIDTRSGDKMLLSPLCRVSRRCI